jgi:hypothetical protein
MPNIGMPNPVQRHNPVANDYTPQGRGGTFGGDQHMTATAGLTKNRTIGNATEIQAIRPPPSGLGAFSCPRGAMAKRGRPRKDGARYPGGKFKRPATPHDQGHEMLLLRRADSVGDANARDPRACTPIGRMLLRGELADPGLEPEVAAKQGRARYDAFLKYEQTYLIRWGGAPNRPNPHTRSHLASMVQVDCEPLEHIADDDRATQIRRCSLRLRECWARACILGSPAAMEEMERIVLDQKEPAPHSAQMLRYIAPALVKEFKLGRKGVPD